MITKTYTASTNISLSVVLPNKANMRIVFSPLSNGTSVYTTSDESIQKALEQHRKFKSLFRVVEAKCSPETVQAASVDKKLKEPTSREVSPEGSELGDASDTIKVKVTDLSAAKDYLSNKFGVSRTAIKLTTQTIAFAKARNIEFIGL